MKISIGLLARKFDSFRPIVRDALRNGYDQPKQGGRHPAITPDSETDIFASARKNSEKSTLITRTGVLHSQSAKLAFQITRGWVDCFVGRNLPELNEMASTPQGERRLEILRIFLCETVGCK
jgi:hypothetical protein